MQIECKQCGTNIPADDVNLENLVAKCRKCHAVFEFADQLRHSRPRASYAESRAPRAEVAMPPGIRIERGEPSSFIIRPYRDGAQPPRSNLMLVRRWFNPMTDLFLVVFAIAWNAFLLFWYSTAFSQPDTPWIMIVFPIGHLAVGIGIGYRALAGLFNRTIVAVSPQSLSVEHVPLPWLGARELAADDVTQLYCLDKVTSHRSSHSVSYEVHANLANGSSIVLVKGLTSLNQALYIEQEVEKALGIRDIAVPGELKSAAATA